MVTFDRRQFLASLLALFGWRRRPIQIVRIPDPWTVTIETGPAFESGSLFNPRANIAAQYKQAFGTPAAVERAFREVNALLDEWSAQRWVRIVDPDGKRRIVTINSRAAQDDHPDHRDQEEQQPL
jgi:hypothetical protein